MSDSAKALPDITEVERFLIVGIGASAGGLEAYERLVGELPADGGMAYVLVQHLDPDHESLAPELIGRRTTMPVSQVRGQVRVRPDHIFVIPPNALLTLRDGMLSATSPTEVAGRRAAIDHFLQSLAEEQREWCAGIVLSGAGSDGTIGLRAIKEHGGLTLAQDPQTARFDSMPRSAVAAGAVDYVLRVEEIPARLDAYARHLRTLSLEGGTERLAGELASHLPAILDLLLARTGHSFTQYKVATVLRRVQRRMLASEMHDPADYLRRLSEDRAEVRHLFQDLLIGVTRFFRDPEAYDALDQQVLQPLVQECLRRGDGPRIWVPGCATGEEAYSIGMLLYQHLAGRESGLPFRIFGTDIDEEALEQARRGWYPETIAEHVEAERLSRFFTYRDGVYRVAKPLRDCCVFSPHNVLSDPPFSRLDLISCRNLLIYLDADLQRRMLPIFHYALRRGGALFLGLSESVSADPQLFKAVDKTNRIFVRRDVMVPRPIGLPLEAGPRPLRLGEARLSPPEQPPDLQRVLERVILDDYAPPGVLINERGDVVYFAGHTGTFLEPPVGAPTASILGMARPDIRLELRTAIHRAVSGAEPLVEQPAQLQHNGAVMPLTILVRPLREAGADAGLFLVLFRPAPVRPPAPGDDGRGGDQERMVLQLEDELRTVKANLQATIEELETSNEELRSSNEELLSMNEELQSSNEELQTSKEELQSLNEELHTVNTELNEKIEELDRAHGDLENLFESTDIATVFLDQDLRVQRFTPAATRLFRLIGSDVGRQLTDLAMRLSDPELVADVRQVLRTRERMEREIEGADPGEAYIRRVLPYRQMTGEFRGVVLTVVDVSALKQAQRQESQLAAIIDASAFAVVGRAPDGTITTWSAGAERLFGYPASEAIGATLDLILADDAEARAAAEQQVLASRSPAALETTAHRRDGSPLDVHLILTPTAGPGGAVPNVAAILHDISERKAAERAVAASEFRLRTVLDALPVRVSQVDRDLRYVWVYNAHPDFRGISLIGRRADEVMPPALAQPALDFKRRILESGQRLHEAISVDLSDGIHSFDLVGEPVRDASGQVIGALVASVDFTARAKVEAELRRTFQRYRSLVHASATVVWSADAEGRFGPEQSAWAGYTGQTREQYEGRGWLDALHPRDRDAARRQLESALQADRHFEHEARLWRAADATYRCVVLRAAPVRGDDGTTREWIGTITDDHERIEALDEVRLNEQRLRAVVHASPLMVFNQDRSLRYVWVQNPLGGLRTEDVVQRTDDEILAPAAAAARVTELKRRALDGSGQRAVVAAQVGGTEREFDWTVEPLHDRAGAIVGVTGCAVDVTDRRRVEEHLRQVQRMEAAGQLAGGMAHEVNNMMTAVGGFAHFVLGRLEPDHPCRDDLLQIQRAADRAAGVTRQLLAFSRRQVLSPVVLDVVEVLQGMLPLLRRVLEADQQVDLAVEPPVGAVRIDRNQFEQVLVNLALNARHAMDIGGTLAIAVRQVELDRGYADRHRLLAFTPGPYVQVTVADDGCGMTPEVRDRVFEPFFTTKEVGEGTGLGLSTVYGTVKQSGGFIWVESVQGRGTTFTIDLPVVVARPAETEEPPAEARGGSETVLVLEDEEAVREFTRRTLSELGYRVLTAERGRDAVRVLEETEGRIDLMVCDIGLPDTTARLVVAQARRLMPDLPILFISGFAGHEFEDRDALGPHERFLPKPYSPEELGRQVRGLLDRRTTKP